MPQTCSLIEDEMHPGLLLQSALYHGTKERTDPEPEQRGLRPRVIWWEHKVHGHFSTEQVSGVETALPGAVGNGYSVEEPKVAIGIGQHTTNLPIHVVAELPAEPGEHSFP